MVKRNIRYSSNNNNINCVSNDISNLNHIEFDFENYDLNNSDDISEIKTILQKTNKINCEDVVLVLPKPINAPKEYISKFFVLSCKSQNTMIDSPIVKKQIGQVRKYVYY
ncbi:hypothetical protein DDB_G0280939 [Dictyostelium discoideum AX4]|uniref:Uncharacterized protein n=1 Tax=Dictyostelium discoideum TaxID=44689 RepID=Q54US5_DICDI|nr:hypothetical protein DDB_G0280939 [Dictyostelium discoideum AX4]EAL67011.1 hypothetical protein DDB_G0280939 [Dictyostelium discoideum AX4]|eukprot:XP_640946.1 hypothetical protein DDB_G0280939 [Dictyostelium discoideum AX4]